jgi:tetratricopeptide (TPR) repeat protein
MTVASENKLGLEDHLIMQGMALKVVESTGADRVDTEVGQRVFGDAAHFRGIANPRVRKDDNDMRLVSNYISAMFQVVEEYERDGKSDSALFMAEKAVALRPSESAWQAYAYLARIYVRRLMYNRLDSLIAGISPATGERILLAVAQEMIVNREFEKAASLLEHTLLCFPSSFAALNNLVVSYYQRGDTSVATEAMRKFRRHNSGDSTLMRSLDEMTKRLEAFPLRPSGAE